MINLEQKSSPQFDKSISKEKKFRWKPITSEQSKKVSGEIGESEYNPIEYFEKEYKNLGESFKGGLGLGSREALIKWDRDAKAHIEKRRKLKDIIKGLKLNNAEAVNNGIDFLSDRIIALEKYLAPLVIRENNLNIEIDNMKQVELSGGRDFGYLKFHAKNQELDDLYKKLNAEKKLVEPNRFRLRDIENNILEAEYIRDNTKFGSKARELRNVQETIEKINFERTELDILINRLKKNN